ncbi:hypothetical protein [Streptomyces sp. NPDC086147]|uniref:hypothetical protein n=1 Tax=unclassified Streptomyces TaxID=2593676 RepID=UPI00344D323D
MDVTHGPAVAGEPFTVTGRLDLDGPAPTAVPRITVQRLNGLEVTNLPPVPVAEDGMFVHDDPRRPVAGARRGGLPPAAVCRGDRSVRRVALRLAALDAEVTALAPAGRLRPAGRRQLLPGPVPDAYRRPRFESFEFGGEIRRYRLGRATQGTVPPARSVR